MIGGMTSTVTNFTSDTLLPIRMTLITGQIRKCIVKDSAFAHYAIVASPRADRSLALLEAWLRGSLRGVCLTS